jgi:hypothetical protein
MQRKALLFVALWLVLLSTVIGVPVSAQIDPQGTVGPDTYPHGVNPLTGLVVPDANALLRHPIDVKISNAPPLVRPQAASALPTLSMSTTPKAA